MNCELLLLVYLFKVMQAIGKRKLKWLLHLMVRRLSCHVREKALRFIRTETFSVLFEHFK